MNGRLARFATAAGMLLATTSLGLFDSPSNAAEQIMPQRCGFYEINPPVGELTGRYVHCADSFILIKFHWSNGSTGTTCVPPWWQIPFYRDGQHRVVNAYYVTTPPNLTGPPHDRRCSLGQPRV